MNETDIVLRLWGREVAAASWTGDAEFAVFQYDPGFAASGIELSPLKMPSSSEPYQFPSAAAPGACGLPGLLGASLPGETTCRLLDWLQQRCWQVQPCVNPLDILGVLGGAGPGALEFRFAGAGSADARSSVVRDRIMLDSSPVEIHPAEFVSLAQQVCRQFELASEQSRECSRLPGDEEKWRALLLSQMAAANQPKRRSRRSAIYLAYDWKSATGECQTPGFDESAMSAAGFQSWLMKVYPDKQWLSAGQLPNDRQHEPDELQAPASTGSSTLAARLEYALNLMAHAARLNMVESRIQKLESSDHGRHECVLAIRRVDKGASDESLHVQSWSALSHNVVAKQSVDDWIEVWSDLIEAMRRLSLQRVDVEQMFSQAAFLHMLGDTQSSQHGNNGQDWLSFLASLQFVMDKTGQWRLAAPNMMFDHYVESFLENSEAHTGDRISRSGIAGLPAAMPTDQLLEKMASLSDIKPARARSLIEQSKKSFGMWTQFAAAAGLEDRYVAMVAEGFVRQTEAECL